MADLKPTSISPPGLTPEPASTLSNLNAKAAAPIDPDRLLTFKEGMDLLQVGRQFLWQACNAGKVPHLRLGRLIRFRRSALLAWLADAERKEGRR